MKAVDLFILVTLAAIPATYVYQKYQREEDKLSPVVGAVQVVRAIRFIDGMPNTTQVSTDQGEFLIARFVEIPLNIQVIVRKKDDTRWLCQAPTEDGQAIKSLPCWILVSRTPEATQ